MSTGWAPPSKHNWNDWQNVCKMCQHTYIAHYDVDRITGKDGCWPIRLTPAYPGRKCDCDGFIACSKAFKQAPVEIA